MKRKTRQSSSLSKYENLDKQKNSVFVMFKLFLNNPFFEKSLH